MSKAASIQLNTLLAQELRQKGVKVRVNRSVFIVLLRGPGLELIGDEALRLESFPQR